MMKTLSFVALAAIATALLSLPGTAKAQMAFGGTFRGPHGSVSIGVGDPFAPEVGAYVPYGYAEQVYLDPDYGYGFNYDSSWVACRRYGSRWIIAESPVVYERPIVRDYAYRYGYRSPSRYYGRESFRRDWDRRFDGRRDRWDGRFEGRRAWWDRRFDGRRDQWDGRFEGRR